MGDQPKVHGFMALKDEWPLCALSICHALEHHVDDLLVLDHDSNDATVAGLAALGHRYGNRLTILRLEGLPFWQAEITTEVVHRIDAAPDDWLYVLDADEFMLVDARRTLRDVLGDLAPDISSVRYGIDNWVSREDFDEAALDGYLRLTARSIPTTFTPTFELKAQDITRGFVNYFDVPFASKVIMRRRAFGSLPIGGVHYFDPPTGVTPVQAQIAELRVAHLPLLTRARLDARATRRAFASMNKPKVEGWQVDVFIDVADAGGLDEFWRRHSMGDGMAPAGSTPTIVEDDRLRQALHPTVEVLRSAFGDRLGHASTVTAPARPLPAAWIEGIRARRAENEPMIDASHAKIARHQALLDERWWRWEAALQDVGIEARHNGDDWPIQGRAAALRIRARRLLRRTARAIQRRSGLWHRTR